MRSPIPGRLIKLLVKAGDAVAAGQTMVVLEAMKMENELARAARRPHRRGALRRWSRDPPAGRQRTDGRQDDGKAETLVDLDEGQVRVDGQPFDVSVTEAEAGIWILRRGNEQTVAQVDGRGSKLTVEIRRPGRDAVLLAAEVSDARRAPVASPQRVGAGAAPVTVRSPIPGRLTKLLVKVGDTVAAGQTLVVLEAMKMENELAAPRAGRDRGAALRRGRGRRVGPGPGRRRLTAPRQDESAGRICKAPARAADRTARCDRHRGAGRTDSR